MDVVFHVTAGERESVESASRNAENLLADETVDLGAVALVANADPSHASVAGRTPLPT